MTAPVQERPSASASPWAGRTVLVVEDSVVQRNHLTLLLQRMGFGHVLAAAEGGEALQVLREHGKGAFLVLTDIDMPGMDGIQLIGHLTRQQLAENLIVMSARDPRLLEIVESMGEADANIHLLGTVLKPVQQLDLERLLETTRRSARAWEGSCDEPAMSTAMLGAALREGQFLPWYQPKVMVDTGIVKGVEALARWQHPKHGVLGPAHFIPHIEGTSLMAPFTLALVKQVLRDLAAWRQVLPTLSASINLSADNVSDDSFTNKLIELVGAHGIPPQAVVWEVTETTVMRDLSKSLANLARLGLKGFGLAMDDYGIGYSSLQQLSRCPFTELKVDRLFVNGAATRPNRRAILESAIQMGHKLGTTVVAEGVETEADWQLLRELGCDLGQGYLAARPMPAGELVGWVRDNRARLRNLARPEPDAGGQPQACASSGR